MITTTLINPPDLTTAELTLVADHIERRGWYTAGQPTIRETTEAIAKARGYRGYQFDGVYNRLCEQYANHRPGDGVFAGNYSDTPDGRRITIKRLRDMAAKMACTTSTGDQIFPDDAIPSDDDNGAEYQWLCDESGEITKISGIHGAAPGMVDVTVRNHSPIRVALDWGHVDDKTHTLTSAAYAHIEKEVLLKGHFGEVLWE